MNKQPIEEVVTFKSWDMESDPTYGYLDGPGYGGLIESLGVKIVLDVSDDDYQGDSYLVLQDGEKWGVLTYGWGSCSGCDAYEACHTVESMSELRDGLEAGISWYDSLDGLKAYLAESGNFNSWREDDDLRNSVAKFKREAAAL